MRSFAWLGAGLVLLTSAPLFAHADTPTVGPLYDADAPVFGNSKATGNDVRAASDGTNTLVVWSALGTPPTIEILPQTGGATSASVPLPAGTNAYRPSVAYGGGKYLVAWDQNNNNNTGVQAVFVSPTGTPMSGFQVASNGYAPSVGFDGTKFLVVWQASGGLSTIAVWAAYVDATGAIGQPIQLDNTAPYSGTNQTTYPNASCGAGKCLVTWTGSNGIYGTVLTPAVTTAPAPTPYATAASSGEVSWAAFNGTDFLLAWQQGFTGADPVKGVRVDTTGAVLGAPIVLGTGGGAYPPFVASDGTDFLVSWGRGSQIDGVRVSGAGALIDASPKALMSMTSASDGAAIAFDGAHYVLPWSTYFAGIFATRIDPATAQQISTQPIDVSVEENTETRPVISASSNGYLVAWRDAFGTSGGRGVRGVRLDAMGKPIDATSFSILGDSNDVEAAMASDGKNWLVVKSNLSAGALQAVVVDAMGSVTPPATLPSMNVNQLNRPGAASDGSQYFVAWVEPGTPAPVRGLRLNASGSPIDAMPIMLGQAVVSSSVTVSWDGAAFEVFWQGKNAAMLPEYQGVRVTPSGTLDGSVFSTGQAAGNGDQTASCSSMTCLFVWGPSGKANPDALRFQGGSALDAMPVALPIMADFQDPIGLAWQADHWLAAGGFNGKVGVARIGSDGTVLDPMSLAVDPTNASHPSVASATADKSIVALDEKTTDLKPVQRVRLSVIGGGSSPSSTTTSSGTGTAANGATSGASSGAGGGTSGAGGGSSGGGKKSGCSCSTVGEGGGSGAAVAVLVALGATLRRKRFAARKMHCSPRESLCNDA